MDFTATNRPLDKIKTDALIVTMGKKSDLPTALPEETGKQLASLIKAGDFSGSKGQTAWLHNPAGISADRILLVGTGDSQPSDQQWQSLLRNIVKAVISAPVKHAVLLLDDTLPQTLE